MALPRMNWQNGNNIGASNNSIFKSDPFKQGVGAAAGAASGALNLFGGMNQEDPSQAANQYFNKIPGAIDPYYRPFINNGMNAGNQLNQQYGDLVNNPGGKFNQIGQSFHESPGFQFQMQQGLNGANSAAAAGGLLGTNAHQQQASTVANGLANQDYYNYMGNALGLYGQGLTGLNNQYQTGYNASNELGQSIGNTLGAQGQLAYAGANNRNQNQQGMFGDLGNTIQQYLPMALAAFG